MPSLPPSTSSPLSSVSTYSFWIGLGVAGAAIALAVLGFSLEREGEVDPPSQAPLLFAPTDSTGPVFLPTSDSPGVTAHARLGGKGIPLYQAEVGDHEGRRVYRIRATAGGDEIVVDFTTGKFIAVRELTEIISPSPAPVIADPATSY
jgi:hypothetical protein